MSKIISLEVNNIKRIKALKITPDGETVIISGPNGNGKSSTLDSIMMALCGGKKIPSKPVREGEETASITVELEEYTVRRWWTTPDKSHIELKLKSGAKISNAQTELDRIVGNLSFDPLEFATMKPKDQLNMLKEISGLDFTKLDSEYDNLFAQRTAVKRDGDNFSSTMDAYKDVVETKIDMDIEEINEARALILAHNKKIVDAQTQMIQNNNYIKNNSREIEIRNQKIEELKDECLEIEERSARTVLANEDLAPIAQAEKLDATELDAKVAEFHKHQANQTQLTLKKNLSDKLENARSEWKRLDTRLKEILVEKETLVKNSNMPIEGLALGSNGIIFNDIPFEQLSTSEQIKISMSVAMALNPKLRVAIIKNISLVDKKGMAEISRIAKEKDFQIWVEKVADSQEANAIYIEDGEIK